MSKPEIVIYAPVRKPIGTFGGALKDIPPTVPGAAVVRETSTAAEPR
jgi:acetyl-CoA C-acetyltransferase